MTVLPDSNPRIPGFALNVVLMLAFVCLAGFKFLAITSGGGSLVPALVFLLMFGAPQLPWVLVCSKPQPSRFRTQVTLFVALVFLGTSVLFGYFPGVTRPAWGGEGHFEVPAALLVEGVVSVAGLVALLVFKARQGAGGVSSSPDAA